jgi:deazaflavin-dependent oxidoreductase (nitroreductase family)
VRTRRERIHRLIPVQNKVLNPPIRAIVRTGISPTYAILETTGRRSGRPRQIPVANGLDGNTFWLICALGHDAAYLKNIQANPRVRVRARPVRLRDGLRMRWYTGTAHSLPDDDARRRQRELGRGRPGYRLDAILLRAIATDMLTVRIDLDHVNQP